MDMLANTINGREVRKACQNLPKDTSEIYDETMKRVEGQTENRRTLAKHVFSWVICAYRQLSLVELQHALAVSSDYGMSIMDVHALVDEKILTSVCAGLVIVDRDSNVVRLVRESLVIESTSTLSLFFADHTAQEYFEHRREIRLPEAQPSITKACLAYLSFDVFQRGYCVNDNELETKCATRLCCSVLGQSCT